MQNLQLVLEWLDGKKTYIFSILSLTNAFVGGQGFYNQETMAYIQAVLAVLAGGAEYSTVKLGARR